MGLKHLRNLFLLVALLFGVAVHAQVPSTSGNITTQNLAATGACTAGSCVEIEMTDRGTVTVQVTDTYTGALSGQVTTNGATWITLAPTPFTPAVATGTPTATIASAATGAWQVSAAAGYFKFRLIALAAVTGTARITLQTSAVSIGSSASVSGGTDGVAQGSTTSGQSGPLSQCAVTTSAPTYTTGQTSPVSCDTSGNVRITGAGGGGTSSTFGAAVPSAGTAAGLSDGTNMVLPRAFDADSGAGTQTVAGVSLRKTASGGSVEAGTSTDPLRTDPTGTTTQPVSGTVTANVGTGTQAISAASASIASGAIASGAMVDLGAQADSAAAADTSTASLIALMKRNNQNLTTLNTSVNADPTAATPIAPATATATKGLLIGSQYNSTVPTFTNGQQGSLQIDASGRLIVTGGSSDACQTTARSYAPVDIVTATTTRVITPTASQKAYICGMFLFSAGTNNVAIVEGTGGSCVTGIAGIIGGTTAAEGPNLTAQVGFVLPNTGYAQAATAGTNVDVCLITSAAVQLSGHIVYVKAP